MPTAYPSVRNGQAALYPFTKRIRFDTGICYNSNATEQRWKKRAPLYEFEWGYNSITKADAASLVNFVNGQFGMNGASWQFTLGATTYTNLALLSDVIEVQQVDAQEYNVKLSARQTQNRGWTPPAVANDWPTFSSGAHLQFPYAAQVRNLTTVGESPWGPRYSFPWWGNSLSGFPAGQLRGFPIQMVLPDMDALTLETFFLAMQGRLTNLNFTDPFSASSYYKMRFGGPTSGSDAQGDTLELRYEGVNQVAVSVYLVEVF